jgi:hypothetical protein
MEQETKKIPWKIYPLDSKPDDSLLEIPRDEEGYYLDNAGNRVAFNGNRELKPAFCQLPLNQYHLEEIYKSATDLHYFIFNYCKVLTKKGWAAPELRDYQEEFIINSFTDKRLGLLAGRQLGKTTASSLKFLWSLNFTQDTSIGICANVEKGANEVLHKLKQTFNKLPIWLQQGVAKWNVKSVYLENGSKAITSATNGDAFRGFSFVGGVDQLNPGISHSTLYVDECAFIDKWGDFSDSVLPTVSSDPNANIILTSTPNGMNHWYDIVKKGRAHQSEFKIQEVPWDCLPERTEEWRQKIIQTHGLIYFNQNYGCQFIGSSQTLLDAATLDKLTAKSPLDESSETFTVYQKPRKDSKYVVLWDLASGTGGDYTIGHVIKILKGSFEQVALFRSNSTALIQLPQIAIHIAKQYNNAYLFFELNYGAEVPSRIYNDFEYDNLLTIAQKDSKQVLMGYNGAFRLGLHVSTKIKDTSLVSLKSLLDTGKLILNDHETIQEFYNFIQKPNGSFSAEQGKHDDTVMALALLGWLVTQDTFKEIVEFDYLSEYEERRAEELEVMFPASMFNDCFTEEEQWTPLDSH